MLIKRHKNVHKIAQKVYRHCIIVQDCKNLEITSMLNNGDWLNTHTASFHATFKISEVDPCTQIEKNTKIKLLRGKSYL